MEIGFPVEFLVRGTPVSLQGSSRSRREWKQRVKVASYTALPEGHWWFEGPIAVTILYFPSAPMQGDIDNIIKPILDALCAHVYKDDNQVVRVMIQKIEPNQPAMFRSPSVTLTAALVGSRPLTYIRLSDLPFEDLT